jgi:sec-independent protein translocase protein TatB
MFDIGWSEMAVVALIALLIIGPKDLPKVMRSAAHWARKARGLAREFQSGVDDMIREADLEDARKLVETTKSMDVSKAIGEAVDPTGDIRDTASELEQSARDTVAAGDDSGKDSNGGKDSNSGGDKAEDVVAKAEAEPNIAPPHSLTPPEDTPEDTPETPPEPASSSTADDSADKRVS